MPFISTEGALRRPMTNDDHPTHPIPPDPQLVAHPGNRNIAQPGVMYTEKHCSFKPSLSQRSQSLPASSFLVAFLCIIRNMIDIEVVVDSIRIKQFKIIPGDVLVYQPWRRANETAWGRDEAF